VASDTHAITAPHAGHAHDDHDERDHGHGALQHQFEDMAQQKESISLAMWLFLATEVMMFGGLFFAYTLYRSLYPAAYDFGSRHLNIDLGTINTFVLLASSYTMALAVRSAMLRSPKVSAFFMFVTWVFGAAFIGIKAIEWGHDYHIGLIPGVAWFWFDQHPDAAQQLIAKHAGPHQVMMYFAIYFCMTGLHAIHMIIGLALVGYFIFLSLKGQFMGGNHQPVEILGLYWHLVDIIWIFLFPLLYLIGGFHPGQSHDGGGGQGGGGH